MVSLQSLAGARPVHWLTLSAAILIVDYATGPYIQFPILFVFPVALAVAGQGRPVGIAVATFLPLFRLTFYLDLPLPASWTLQIARLLAQRVNNTTAALMEARPGRDEEEDGERLIMPHYIISDWADPQV